MKSRSRKINVGIQKFNGHCKKVVDLKKNGYMKNDVLINACHLEGSNFALEHTWRLLKWLEQCIDTSSKRIKLYAIRDYSLPTTTGVSESDTHKSSTQWDKRTMKGKGVATSSPIVHLFDMEDAIGEKMLSTKEQQAKEMNKVKVLYEIMMKNTSIMSEDQVKKHKITCNYILHKFNN